jgi:hypothetical protein
MKIAEIIKRKVNLRNYEVNDDKELTSYTIDGQDQAAAEILALIPKNMEVPALENGNGLQPFVLSIERRNLILGRNAGLDEARAALEGK